MNLKYLLKKNLNIKNGYLIAIMIALILVVGGSFTYALFTSTNESKGALNIITGNLYPHIESDALDNNKEISVAPKEAKYISIKLANINSRDAKVNLYYSFSEASDKVEVRYLTTGDTPPTNEGYVLAKNGTSNDSKTINVRIVNNDTKNIIVRFGSSVGLAAAVLDFPVDKYVLTESQGNDNILVAYTYNQITTDPNYCITGEEATCQVNKCYLDKNINACPAGTIFRYRVNDTEYKYFHVVSDVGDKLTLQQRENTVLEKPWYEEYSEAGEPLGVNNNSHGPLALLTLVEEATANWNYVNDITYTMGTTPFKDISNTGCLDVNGCPLNSYVLDSRTAKARMITLQEAVAVGCNNDSCPIWMHNYLSGSKSYGGSVNGTDNGYWTMSATSDYLSSAWLVYFYGSVDYDVTSSDSYGGRAVIEINKGNGREGI